ncbi:MAG: hypothetical protein AAGD35_18290 [Actinomycetota bacterium]
MSPESGVDHAKAGAKARSIRFVRDPGAERPGVAALFEQLAAEDDAAVAALYDESREQYHRA